MAGVVRVVDSGNGIARRGAGNRQDIAAQHSEFVQPELTWTCMLQLLWCLTEHLPGEEVDLAASAGMPIPDHAQV